MLKKNIYRLLGEFFLVGIESFCWKLIKFFLGEFKEIYVDRDINGR